MTDGTELTVATWNVQAIRRASEAKAQRIATVVAGHHVDIIALQEVGVGVVSDRILTALDGIGLRHTVISRLPTHPLGDKRPKSYGNVIASSRPLAYVTWPVRTRWPQLIAAVRLDTPTGRLLAVTAHIPNGSGNGWEKVYAFEGLAAGLATFDEPTVLMGDFNEPKAFTPVFTSSRGDRHGGYAGAFTDTLGVSH